MPTFTPKLGLPIPALADSPSAPVAVGNLATAIDNLGIIGGKRRTASGGAVLSIESTVVDTQTLALPANSVFIIDFFLCFTVSIAGSDVDMKIRQTSISGAILAEATAIGTYVSPQPNYGHLTLVYKTTSTAELDYFAGTIIRVGAGSGTATAIVPTSIIVTNVGPSTIIGDF